MKKAIGYAHCDGPCGIYDPASARIAGEAVLSMTKKMLELKCPDTSESEAMASYLNTMSRYASIKEEQSQLCKDEILLARSSRFPEKMYSTLAGFVEPGETLEQTLDREVFEEVGVTVRNIRYFGSQPWPFPASLMLGFFAEAINQNLKIDYNEIEDAQWFKLSHLKNLTHPKIKNGFKLPRVDSIARRLVNHWININS